MDKNSTNNYKQDYTEKMNEKKREARIVRRIVLVLVLILLIGISVAGFGTYRYVMNALSPVNEENPETIEVSIPIGSSSSAIGTILEEANVIEDGTIFRYYVRLRSESGFQAGNYLLNQTMDVDEIIAALKDGRVEANISYTFTIPEGWWAKEIFARVDEETNVSELEISEKAREEEYLNELIERYTFLTEDILQEEIREPLEGYLFPARYDFIENELSAEMIIERMLDRTAMILDSIEIPENTSIHELMAWASIIEGEASSDEERARISGVIDNRMGRNMQLQMDPTVGYAHGERLSVTTYADLQLESPYNTYDIVGLPVGPINNPGEASIRAALEPESHLYLYFFHAPDGEVFFNEDFEEHDRIVQEYRDNGSE